MEFESMDENILGFKDNLCFTSIFMKFGKKSSEGKEKMGQWRGEREKKEKRFGERRKEIQEEGRGGRRTHHPDQSCMWAWPAMEHSHVQTFMLLVCLYYVNSFLQNTLKAIQLYEWTYINFPYSLNKVFYNPLYDPQSKFRSQEFRIILVPLIQ